MTESFVYSEGSRPLLISMPHNASLIPTETAESMTPEAKGSTDTDWFLDRLYDFAHELGAHLLKPTWSRYYIDLNRDPSGKDLYPGADNTELCPTTNFANQPLYLEGMKPGAGEIEARIGRAWKPYHQCIDEVLKNMVATHGYAILFEAHSIRSRVPRFFEGQLPDFNFGTANGYSCDKEILKALESLDYQDWSTISNGRFKGGYITRHYGNPAGNIHAIQLELSQATYMNEDKLQWDSEKAERVKPVLESIIQCLLDWGQKNIRVQPEF